MANQLHLPHTASSRKPQRADTGTVYPVATCISSPGGPSIRHTHWHQQANFDLTPTTTPHTTQSRRPRRRQTSTPRSIMRTEVKNAAKCLALALVVMMMMMNTSPVNGRNFLKHDLLQQIFNTAKAANHSKVRKEGESSECDIVGAGPQFGDGGFKWAESKVAHAIKFLVRRGAGYF